MTLFFVLQAFKSMAGNRWFSSEEKQAYRSSFGSPVKNDANFFKGNQSAIHHFIQPWQNLLDAFAAIDDLKNNRKILRHSQQPIGVIHAGPAKSSHSPQNRCT